MKLLKNTLSSINGRDEEEVKSAWKRIDNLTKPIGSLGELEEISAKVAGIRGNFPDKIKKKNIVIMCSDNGVWEEGIGSCNQDLTVSVTNNFTRGITGVCILSDFYGSDRTVVDIGIKVDMDNPQVINRKINYGTRNMAKEAAMTREEAVRAIEVGIEMVDQLAEKGYDLLGTGEMGVCNTATSSAVLSVLSGISPNIVVGRGSGITDEQLSRKLEAVKRAIDINKPDPDDVIDVLSKVGGFDICGLCGCFLGAAKNRIPIVIDGLISSVAALCAARLKSCARDFMFPSHLSAEPGAGYVMKELGLTPMLNLNMRLGEGSGCPLAFSIIEASIYAMNNMVDFEDSRIDRGQLVDIREKKGGCNL
ncbi:MAG: nicotinate-nucleotide--dimethylbenzimidazole phosphoribosyltransferase [Clostridium sp.]|jgi:nicotinate-nucleotide--dimethylbenzimidazole phosphoribosyltransferase|uniref:nicotinate-nucleotide--dimethylbenzimidazole phosphoribosyltransferase n=1 Tax=Clostridium sp. TaxID=1506 RepID=UPI0025C4DEA8|nr:nicotinate-nucleotide--dimethylbenzimidazole phosphoribosyltransferase [Clostridium sp.]MCH3962924.1 nicotinate-nucleotide--dimethylbenzimidazole phosphoribosyltransferase [Clostridium sp.]MCI1715661.1 nicotinate-nucleotide--dimethylbenzimidazole phosphoribosyltransferase [Clostridium sp.]MCI1800135.1 nicotinate-nucleotide--dimethylbenzimidazole phosphoribosyltransferase [Clostridium sp.]MCI1814048.1 nicotinate-nucleotide--dimethylbenzimidazole phosphoribosyltransferase [Clostridium sp.]MCI